MAALIPLALRLAVRSLPREEREEVLRELLEQHRTIGAERGRWRVWLWSWRQPLVTWVHRGSGRPSWTGLAEDIVASQRSLRRQPVLALTVIATMTISIGAIAAVAGVIDAVLLRPLPFPAAQQLVWLGTFNQREGATFDRTAVNFATSNPMDVVDWAQRERRFAAVAPFETFEGTAEIANRPIRIDCALMGREMNNVLRVKPFLGRLFAPTDFGAAPRVAALTYEFWRSAFGGDAGVVGRTVSIDDESIEIIGVLPDLGMDFPEAGIDMWMPLPPLPPAFANRGGAWQRVLGRLDENSTVDAAEADMDRIARELEGEHADTNKNRRIAVVPLRDALVGSTRSVLWLLAGSIVLVLLIASANVGHLLLVNAQSRRRELALRAALGATPARIARLLLIESAWLSIAGGFAGLFAGSVMLKGFVAVYPDQLPAVGHIAMSAAAFVAAAAAVVMASVVGVAPSLIQARARRLQQAMRASERGTDDRSQRNVRAMLIVTQVALSTTLLISGGLLFRSFLNIQSTDPGFSPASVLTFNISLSEHRYPTLADEVRFYDDLLGRLRGLPGVTAAGTTTLLPFTPGEFGDGFYRVGMNDAAPNVPIARLQNVMPGYMEGIGLRLKIGRTLQPTDTAASPYVVVVNEAMQRRFFPGGALGQRIRFRGRVAEIVGLVGDKLHRGLRDAPRPEMFFPRAQVVQPRLQAWVALRVSGAGMSLLPAVQRDIAALDPGVAVEDPRLMSERLDRAIAPDRFRAYLIGAMAITALTLAALGLYGLIAYAVARDARAIAIRTALGASAARTVAGVLRSAMTLTSLGVIVGVGGALATQGWLADFVVGVGPRDPLTLGVVAIGLMLVAVVAAAGPARRASRVDPITVLRGQ